MDEKTPERRTDEAIYDYLGTVGAKHVPRGLKPFIVAQIRAAVAAEREACAREADAQICGDNSSGEAVARFIAYAIRDRRER